MTNVPLTTNCPGPRPTLDRRDFLERGGLGLGSIALASLLARDGLANSPGQSTPGNPLAARAADINPPATSVIFLFMAGGPSQVETFDPKPDLTRLHGQPVPASLGQVQTQQANEKSLLLGVKRRFRPNGESGLVMSDLFPHLATCADDLSVVRSMHAESIVHSAALYQMNSGRTLMGHPTIGAWLTYGLGSESDNLPSYVVMLDPDGTLVGGPPCWGAGYFPPIYQGTLFRPERPAILNLRPAAGRSIARHQRNLDLLRQLNQINRRPADPILETRAATYELAFRMQKHAPEAVDISRETAGTQKLYGVDRAQTSEFGRRCLLARRLVERGVRMVQVYYGNGQPWDDHGNIKLHRDKAKNVDQPIAALLRDLKARDLLDDTLVIWGGEFGRTPVAENSNGRDHNHHGFTVWLAGGGVKGGMTYGATDEFGFAAVEKKVHVHDLHATILHLMGLDHERLTFRYSGRDFRLTDVYGSVVEDIIA